MVFRFFSASCSKLNREAKLICGQSAVNNAGAGDEPRYSVGELQDIVSHCQKFGFFGGGHTELLQLCQLSFISAK